MKGILLSGGTGTRLYPATLAINKQLLPVYDKPMVYYPLTSLMLAGIKDILIITTPKDHDSYVSLLGDGSKWGIKLSYIVQDEPKGIAQAFILGKDFIGSDSVCLILGDNIFHGDNLPIVLQECSNLEVGATVFGYHVQDPQRYGVVEFDDTFKAISIEEKPVKPKSHYAVTGIYFYDNKVVEYASKLKPSNRGELEITDINNMYLQKGELKVRKLGRGVAWLDTGTHESLLYAAMFIKVLDTRQGVKVGCPEEVAYEMGYINSDQLKSLAQPLLKSGYGQYLLNIIED
jgi:glucose-1-phosphate thymidylyltransferase